VIRAGLKLRRLNRGFGQGLTATAFITLLAAAGVSWVYMGMVTQEQWPVRLAPESAGSFFTVDLDRIRAAAYRQPWVADATVQKNWPDTIKVHVREYMPVAHWTGNRLISTEGRAFEVPAASSIQGLPWLEGPEELLETVFTTWQQFNQELMPVGLEIEHIRLDARGAWFLELGNGTEVQIGREDALPRLQRLVKSWAGLMRGQDMSPLLVDLRYTNGFAVRWPDTPARIAGNYGQEN
jgi:cell division protein FtsQ